MIRWKKGMKLKTYNPNRRLKVHKHEAFSWIHLIGARFMSMSGGIALFISGFFAGIFGFFKLKGKIREFQRNSERVIRYNINNRDTQDL
jgi:hypothetical protein